jgi:hypothetical protein
MLCGKAVSAARSCRVGWHAVSKVNGKPNNSKRRRRGSAGFTFGRTKNESSGKLPSWRLQSVNEFAYHERLAGRKKVGMRKQLAARVRKTSQPDMQIVG